jgi:hypothetical protein
MKLRELKFSAWDKKTKKWFEKGFHIMGEVMAFNCIEDYIFKNMCGAKTSLERWNDIIIVQHTDYNDINDVSMKDGDIIETKTAGIGIVSWNKIWGCWDLIYGETLEDTEDLYMYICKSEKPEIFSNVFEHSDSKFLKAWHKI